jgi:hypothetical protein
MVLRWEAAVYCVGRRVTERLRIGHRPSALSDTARLLEVSR